MALKAGATNDSPMTRAHWAPVRETVSRRRCSMFSSTAAQVSVHPKMIQPRYGKIGADHHASLSRRITRPLLTALSATTAKAIVIDTDASVVLGSSGPHDSTISAKLEMMKPLITQ